MVVIGLSIWIVVSNRPSKKSGTPELGENYSDSKSNSELSSKGLSIENQRPQQDNIGYGNTQDKSLDVQDFSQSLDQTVFAERQYQTKVSQTLNQMVIPPKQEQVNPVVQKQEDLMSKAYDPNEQSSSLIDGDAVVEDESIEGILGIYLESNKGRIASVPIESAINESTNISITVPDSHSDTIVILCHGYKNYTYNWYRDGGGKRQGCGVIEDDQMVIPCEFRVGQSFCNIRICLFGKDSELNIDLKLEE